MRKFYIENEVGARLALTDSTGLWLLSPKGLGFKMDNTYDSIEPGFFELSSYNESQDPITGTLAFIASNPYKTYQDVINWMITAQSLKFIYIPHGTEEYFRDIHINAVDKTEKSLSRLLECTVSFLPLSPWYTHTYYTFVFTVPVETAYKKYDYTYSFVYAAAPSPNSVEFQIDGHYPGEIELRAVGPFESPLITLTNTVTGELLGKMNLSGIIFDVNETLFFSSRHSTPGVWKITDSETIDLIDYLELDANVETFFKIPPFVPVTATMIVGGTRANDARLNVMKFYRTR